ncbi:loader and inhibitor of phage [Bacillus phage vB_BpsM-61]|nr:loader and inhibitor of phage [Bacillus phage vB_BpsM-61]
MKKTEMVDLLEEIELFFPGRFTMDEKIASLWWRIIKDYDYKLCKTNLDKHVRESKFPPTIAQLIITDKDQSRPYDKDLQSEIENTRPYDDIVRDIEKRTGRKVID